MAFEMSLLAPQTRSRSLFEVCRWRLSTDPADPADPAVVTDPGRRYFLPRSLSIVCISRGVALTTVSAASEPDWGVVGRADVVAGVGAGLAGFVLGDSLMALLL
jgi:hypothetical protein